MLWWLHRRHHRQKKELDWPYRERLASEELDILDQLLSEDDFFYAEIKSAIENMPKEGKSFSCLICPKVCLSSGGLKRHSSSKHSSSPALSSSSTADGSLASSSSRKGKKVEDILYTGIFKKKRANTFFPWADTNGSN